MKRVLAILLVVLMFFSIAVNAEPFGLTGTKSYLIAEDATGIVLEQFNIDEVRSIASLSKIITYCVVMEKVSSGEAALSDKVTISENAAGQGGSSFDLEAGEQVSIEDLLAGLMLASGNDAAIALAEGVSGTEQKFVEEMNEFARALNLKNAYFYNSTGLPLENKDQNRMTARELLHVTRYAISAYPDLLKLTSTDVYRYDKKGIEIRNTNPLIGSIDGIDGLKTGMTDDAGYCLISTGIKKGHEGRSKDARFIGIVLGTDGYKERKETSLKLMKYAYDNYEMRVFSAEEPVGKLSFPEGMPNTADYFPERDIERLIKLGSVIKTKLTLKEGITLPLKAGDEVGLIDFFVNDDLLVTMPAVIREDISKPTIIQQLMKFYSQLFRSLDNKFLTD